MASLATRILDESYDKMKEDFPTDRHDFWDEWPLSDINLKYAAIDAYVTYQLYKKIHFFLRYLVFCPICKREDELRGALCRKCRIAEFEAAYAKKMAASEAADREAAEAAERELAAEAEAADREAAAEAANREASSSSGNNLAYDAPLIVSQATEDREAKSDPRWDEAFHELWSTWNGCSLSPRNDGKRLKWSDEK